MILTTTLGRIEQMLRNQYLVAGTIRHRGERGRQREHGLNQLLRDMLPGAYGVASGEIIPFEGEKSSPQCDTILYDRLHTLVLGRSNLVQQVPAEGVYAVIETKSVIDSKALKDAASKFSTVRSMPRCSSVNRRKRSTPKAPLFILFGYHLESSVKTCRHWVEKNAVEGDLIIAALDGGMSLWIDGHPRPYWVYNYVWETKVETYQILSLFLAYLLDEIRNMDLGKPDFMKLFFGE
jgi:hypothetical protein